ncbi:MAG: MliC family protein [bacterium]
MKTVLLPATMVAAMAGCTMTIPGPPATPASTATPTSGTHTYTCAGGTVIPVTYARDPNGDQTATLIVEGSTNMLIAEGTTAGVTRYSFPSDGSHFTWLIGGNTGTLLWHNGTNNTDEPSQSDCRAR